MDSVVAWPAPSCQKLGLCPQPYAPEMGTESAPHCPGGSLLCRTRDWLRELVLGVTAGTQPRHHRPGPGSRPPEGQRCRVQTRRSRAGDVSERPPLSSRKRPPAPRWQHRDDRRHLHGGRTRARGHTPILHLHESILGRGQVSGWQQLGQGGGLCGAGLALTEVAQ